MSSVSLDQLWAFVAVYESGGFTAAAKRLALTTNAISLRVQKLEEQLGVQLFVRTTRSVAATDEGRSYYERISIVLAELEAAEADLRSPSDELRGTVKLAMPGVIATAGFLARIGDLLDAHPRLGVQIQVTNTPVDVAADGLDIGVVVGQVPESTFVGRRLGRVTWVLAAAPAYLDAHGRPRRAQELSEHRCLRLLARPPQDQWTLVDRRGRETTVAIRGGFVADDSRSLGEATYSGVGIGVRPLGECVRAEQDGRLERVLPGLRFSPLDVYALLPKGRLRVPRVAACLEEIRLAVAELA